MSPVLSNIYLHFTLDLWFERKFQSTVPGRGILGAYADDLLGRFQFWGRAQNFQRQLRERIAQFNPELAEEKTRLLLFGRFAAVERHKHGQRPETFETARLRKGLLLQGSSLPSLAFRFSVHTVVEGRVGQHFGRGGPTESYTANVLNGRV